MSGSASNRRQSNRPKKPNKRYYTDESDKNDEGNTLTKSRRIKSDNEETNEEVSSYNTSKEAETVLNKKRSTRSESNSTVSSTTSSLQSKENTLLNKKEISNSVSVSSSSPSSSLSPQSIEQSPVTHKSDSAQQQSRKNFKESPNIRDLNQTPVKSKSEKVFTNDLNLGKTNQISEIRKTCSEFKKKFLAQAKEKWLK